tara:strand:+ start:98 stop:364 length:267 start_codon:yes stop_codon:yes gene_type:complete
MKLELRSENENYLESFSNVFKIIFFVTIIFFFCDFALKLGTISKHYQIEYNCRLLSVEKSKTNYKKLSRLLNLKNKQRIWEFCREVVN